LRIPQIETLRAEDRIVNVDDVAQRGEQMLLDAADHLPVDERARRRVLQLELDAPGLTTEANLEVLVAREDRPYVVRLEPRGEHRECAASKQIVDTAAPGIEQLLDFAL